MAENRTDAQRVFDQFINTYKTSIRKRLSVCKEKGFDFLLKAIPKVLTNDCSIRFQIAGDGPDFAELKKLQFELNLDDKVQFLGFRNDVPSLMKAVGFVRDAVFERTFREYSA